MASIYNLDEPPLTKEDLQAAREYANGLLGVWKRRALVATVAFFLSCASVVPFLYGHSFHAYWYSFGKYLVLLSMALLIPFVICVGIAINSWVYARNLQKIEL
jgi:hypothetical protein